MLGKALKNNNIYERDAANHIFYASYELFKTNTQTASVAC